MTTNRMGLEQLSDEQVKELGETLRSWQDGYDPIDDKEQYQLFANTMTALNELLAYRKASKKAVADVVAWNKPGEERKCDIRWRRFDVSPGPLFETPPLQAVTVSDEKCRHEFVCQWHSHGSAFGYQCRICGELESNTEKCHK